jgi:hypothetical protein
MAQLLHLLVGRSELTKLTGEGAVPMNTKCEVVGWVLLDDSARVLVREENGSVAPQSVSADSTFAHEAIQTGSFRRNPIVDPVTHETLGYDWERLPSPLLATV